MPELIATAAVVLVVAALSVYAPDGATALALVMTAQTGLGYAGRDSAEAAAWQRRARLRARRSPADACLVDTANDMTASIVLHRVGRR